MKKNNFWKNKKILITGHTGFKGSWLTLILANLGAKITGYALNPISKPNFFDNCNLSKFLKKDFREDILNIKKLNYVINKTKPSIIFHLAAQSSVLLSYKDNLSTIKTNVIGTANLLELVKTKKFVKSVVIVTTDKVYENFERKQKFKEESKLGGHDIYSSSKAACEILTQSYIKSFYKDSFCNIATVRSGNCIGGGDWTKDRIIKDCVESFVFNKKLIIRSPNATRPWQHVLDPLFGYLSIAEKLFSDKKKKFVGAWNFGPNKKNNLKVKQIAHLGKSIFKSKSKIIVIRKKHHESENLALDSSKSYKLLKWKTYLSDKTSLKMTFDWFKNYYDKSKRKNLIRFTNQQIELFKRLSKF